MFQLDAVFHVVDKQGQKITDDKTIKYIEKVGMQTLERFFFLLCSVESLS